MKLGNSFIIQEETIGATITEKVGGMSTKSLAKFIDIITTQLYSDPEGTIVRELGSNCFDAHIKFQKREIERLGDDNYVYEEAVVVKYSEEEGNGFISFIDKGTGLSPEDMDTIYIEIGNSDKDQDDDFLGAFGIGSKSFLSYTPSIDLITKVDGIKYTYIVFKNGNGLLEYNLLLQERTEDHNGTEVKICIGEKTFQKLPSGHSKEYDYRAKDYIKFRDKVIEQLYYFDNVYTVGFELDNDYQIYETDTFKIRTGDNPFKDLHVILGKVYYPIDWDIIGRERLKIPVGIKFNIGELAVTSSRENLKYNDEERVALINNRIDDVLNEIKSRYNKVNTSVTTLEEFIKHRESPNKIITIGDVDIIIPKKQVLNKKKDGYVSVDVIEGLEEVKWKSVASLPLKIPDDPYYSFYIKGQLSPPDGKGNCKLLESTSKHPLFKQVSEYSGPKFYRIKGERSKITDAYIVWKATKEGKKVKLLGQAKNLGYKVWCDILDLGEKETHTVSGVDLLQKKKIRVPLHKIEKGQNIYISKFSIIKEFKKAITKDLVSRTFSYEKEVPSTEYLSELQLAKIAKRKVKLSGRITIYDLVNDNSGTSSELDLSSLNSYKGFIIYGERDKIKELQGCKEMLSNVPKVRTDDWNEWKATGIIKYRKSEFCNRKVPYMEYRTVHHDGKYTSRNTTSGRESIIRKEVGRIFVTAKLNHKQLQGNPYFMHVDEFMSNNNRMFRNYITAWYIRRELDKIENSHSHLVNNMSKINDKLDEKWTELEEWTSKNYKRWYNNDEFMEICYGIAKEKDMLWDYLITDLERIKKWFGEGLGIFEEINSSVFEDKELFKDVIALLKMKHKRLSAEHYFVLTQEEEQILEQAKALKTYYLSLEPIEERLLIYNNLRTA